MEAIERSSKTREAQKNVSKRRSVIRTYGTQCKGEAGGWDDVDAVGSRKSKQQIAGKKQILTELSNIPTLASSNDHDTGQKRPANLKKNQNQNHITKMIYWLAMS